ncbi:MAG: DUF1109 family protein [Halioglobus sp.]|nr:DUF1109 family protein [Halioglobus sp.]
MNKHRETIDALARELAPVTVAPRPEGLATLWLLGSLAWVVGVALLSGPVRPGALQQLFEHPRFLAEMTLGLAGIGVVVFAVLRSATPGLAVRGLTWVATAVLGLWLGNILLGFIAPTLESSMLGKRPHCFSETLLYALPPLVALAYLVRRLYPLRPAASLVGAGLASGLLPAWFMQMACMYDTAHILLHHVLPGILVIPLAWLAALLLWRRGRT